MPMRDASLGYELADLERQPADAAEAHGPLDAEALLDAGEADGAADGARLLLLRVLFYVLLWYAFSVSLSLYNTWMFSPSGLDLHFPVLMTCLHQLLLAVFSLALIRAWRLPTTWYTPAEYATQVLPTALASAGDIGMGNLSLRFVTLTVYTMLKSAAPGFVLLFSILFGLEAPQLRLVAIIVALCAGVAMMAASGGDGPAAFHLSGALLVLGAAAASGLRWTLTQVLLWGRNHGEKPHPVETILLLSPINFALLLACGLVMEGGRAFLHASAWQALGPLRSALLVALPGVLAFAMTLSEFQVLNLAGALTLAIAGICKEIGTIIISCFVFGDRLSAVNVVGLVMSIGAVAAYNHYRLSQSWPKPSPHSLSAQRARR